VFWYGSFGVHGNLKRECKDFKLNGRAIAQAVSHWLPTVSVRVRSCGICGGQSGSGAGFPSTSFSLADHYSVCSTLIVIHHQGQVQLAK
jgi:hypothetical protein